MGIKAKKYKFENKWLTARKRSVNGDMITRLQADDDQVRNYGVRYSAYGKMFSLGQASKKYDIKYTTLRYRMKNLGLSLEQAIEYNTHLVHGKRMTLVQAAEHYDVKYAKLFYLTKHKGFSLQQAVEKNLADKNKAGK